ESYTAASVWRTLGALGKLTEETNRHARNPFGIQRGSGAAAAYYHHLPSLVHADLSIQTIDPEFWPVLRQFYRDVRNPLFHGSHFASADVSNVRESLRIISEIYAWTDLWQKPDFEPGKRMVI